MMTIPSEPSAALRPLASAEKNLALVLRLLGGLDLCALAAVVIPGEWLGTFHRGLGLGEFPTAPIVGYLARSGSAMYALHGAIVLYVSFDVVRYWPLIRFMALAALVHGALIFGIDQFQELPLYWRYGEGPCIAASGAVVLFLQGRARFAKPSLKMNDVDEILNDLVSDKIYGYGFAPIPSPIDDLVTSVLAWLASLRTRKWRAAVSKLDDRHGFVFGSYARRMASYAVRTGQAEHIQRGLAAVVIASTLVDYRDMLRVVSLLYRSARKLDLNAKRLFRKCPGCGDRAILRDFTSFLRSEEDRRIEAWGFVEGHDADGFLYIDTWFPKNVPQLQRR